MPIVQQGSINTTALVVPDLYVQIVPPQNLVLNGVPTNVVGVVGTASWGAVGRPVIVATMADYAGSFGPIVARKYDMGTQVATAVQQGAQNFRCLRVSDGTDTAAQVTPPGTTFTFTALYSGSLGNQVVLALSAGSKPSTWRLTVSLPGPAARGVRRGWRHRSQFLDCIGGGGQPGARPAAGTIASGRGECRRQHGGCNGILNHVGCGRPGPTARRVWPPPNWWARMRFRGPGCMDCADRDAGSPCSRMPTIRRSGRLRLVSVCRKGST